MAAYNNYMGYGYPYGGYYQPPIQPQPNYNTGNMMNNQQPQVQQNNQSQVQQTSYLPLTYVSGLIGAKSFIVAPNHTIFLRDSDEGSDLLFEKSADMYGKYTIKAYHMKEISLDDIGKPVDEKQKQTAASVNLDLYATKNELNAFKSVFEEKMNKLSTILQKIGYKGKNNGNIKDSDKDE